MDQRAFPPTAPLVTRLLDGWLGNASGLAGEKGFEVLGGEGFTGKPTYDPFEEKTGKLRDRLYRIFAEAGLGKTTGPWRPGQTIDDKALLRLGAFLGDPDFGGRSEFCRGGRIGSTRSYPELLRSGP